MAGTNGAKRGGANGGGGSAKDVTAAREEKKAATQQSVTAKLLDGLSPKERVNYLNDAPIGTKITVESKVINGGKSTNTLIKTKPNYQGYDWKVVSGPKSEIAHFDQTFNPAKYVAYGGTKIIDFKLG